MGELRKITVQVPKKLLEKAQAFTGEGVTETVREGLKRLVSVGAEAEARILFVASSPIETSTLRGVTWEGGLDGVIFRIRISLGL